MNSELRYVILQEFVKQLDFNSPAAPESFFITYEGKSTLSTQIDVESQMDANTGNIFCVNLKLHCSVTLENGNSLFLIDVVYGTIVETSKSLDESELKSLLTVEIPQRIYPHVAVLVHGTTSFSGFSPVMLPNYSFSEMKMLEGCVLDVNELHDSNNQYEESSNFENEPNSILTLKKLLADVESEDAGKEFLETLKRSGGEISGFSNFTLTRTLFKYLSFINYNTTHEIEHDLYAKRLMFFLIVASKDCEWWLVNNNGDKPELFYRYKGTGVDKKVSDLSPEEFVSLAEDLIVNVLTESHVNIFLIEQEYGMFDDLSNPNPSREEYRNAFHYDVLSDEQQEFVDSLYDAISKTKLEAFTLEL